MKQTEGNKIPIVRQQIYVQKTIETDIELMSNFLTHECIPSWE